MKFDRKHLEIQLSGLLPFNSPKNYLEQYSTEPGIAASLLWDAYLDGNIYEKRVIDAGAGNGILSYASLYLGCKFLKAIEIDPDQRYVLEKNLNKFQNKEIVIGDISQINERYDTVLCNPPFGAVRRDADLPFLERIFQLGKNVYIIHNAVNDQFMTGFIKEKGEILKKTLINMDLPKMYSHHTRDHKNIRLMAYLVSSY
ncbi:METTL5 family protein [Cuniculiplasma sp. SKW3]|uniref:METTL5 family protein n=1 Tax=unclassified Cuniculiplasma TaxID=2619706 RepID=UPI003FD0585F